MVNSEPKLKKTHPNIQPCDKTYKLESGVSPTVLSHLTIKFGGGEILFFLNLPKKFSASLFRCV